MKELTIMNFNGIETVDSRQVAEVIGKDHAHLMRDIAKYCGYLNESKIGLVDFFIESTYTDGKGETRPCYLLTRKGCEMVANKMTGQKGTVFTALYVNAFHAMEEHIKQELPDNDKAKRLEIQAINANARMMKAKAEQAKMLLEFAKLNLSAESKTLLANEAGMIITGKQILPLPKTEKTYSAGEVGTMLGVSANKIGRMANALGMKTDEYGMTVLDTAQNGKQIPTFRYNQTGIDKLRDYLENGVKN